VGLFTKVVGASGDPKAHYEYALALVHVGRLREARSQYAQALLILPDFPEALDALAWVLATAKEAEFRNGTEAVRMAERACELTERKDPSKLMTLAAAYAESGRFQEATTVANNAVELADHNGLKELGEEGRRMSEDFKAAKPWREPLRNRGTTQP
jgi:Flp pilus assembly protein TadD